MSTYSNLKIQLIGTGELPGAWGTATNVNWGSTGGGIEQAVVGMATISSGFTGTPLTLTLTLTDTAEAQNARALVLNLTQSLGSAGVLNVPAIQKPYMVINSTGQNVTVQVSGQVSPTPPVIPTGTRAYLYNNGTSVSTFLNYLTSLTLGSALPVASGGTGVTSLGSGVVTWMQTPSSANLAAAVTDETGSGSLVFATSPTLVTPILGVATATSLNKVAVTAPATSATLTLADGSTLSTAGSFATSGANSLTLTTTGATNVTLPTSGTLATTSGTVASVSFGTTGLTPNTATTGAVTVAGTLVPANGGTGVANGSNNTITFTGNYTLGLTLSNNTALTLPTTGTVATLAGSETLTNKTINLSSNTLTATSAQLASAVTDETGSGSLVFATSPTLTTPRLAGSSTGYSSFSSANSSATNYTITFPAENMTVGFRNVPTGGSGSGYTLAVTDVGKFVAATGSITIPNSTFSAGDIVVIYNNSSGAITLTCSIATAYIGGTNTDVASATLTTRGIATVLFIDGTTCVLTGNVS